MAGGTKERSPSKSSTPDRKTSSTKPVVKPPHLKSKKSKQQGLSGYFTLAQYASYLVLPVLFGVGGFYWHHNYIYLPSLVNTPSILPKILADDHAMLKENADRFWGTYRSNLYFGMKTRSAQAPVVGFAWYTQPKTEIVMPKIRHWCSQQDGLSRYGWLEHDGRTFGVQEIVDENLILRTSFVKRFGGEHGGDWTMRIEAGSTDNVDNTTMYSFIVYVAIDGTLGKLSPNFAGKDANSQYIESIDGVHPDLGQFKISFSSPTNVVGRSFLATTSLDLSQVKEMLLGGTGVVQVQSAYMNYYMSLMGYMQQDQQKSSGEPRFLALQVTVMRSTTFEVVFESSSVKNRAGRLIGPVYDEELKKRQADFDERFEKTFLLREKQYPDVYISIGKHALSNMLGSIGYFHGYAKVISAYNKRPVPYGPLTLFSTVPSRSFFPRGFLWDEGFHQILLRRWDEKLSLDILSYWLDLMNVEGWIPREVILGAEAEARVPDEYIVQHNSVANPPMFFYIIRQFLDEKWFRESRTLLDRLYPRLQLWYQWLNVSQSGSGIIGSYRWRGRNETTIRELNPKTLPSGLDDYPRASHPSVQEYHLDLYCWMTLSSNVMNKLADIVGDKTSIEHYEKTAKLLNDHNHLNELHWSDKTGRYCDFGMHTRNVKLERPPMDPSMDGAPKVNQEMIRVVTMEPKPRLVSDTFGYVSLFPLFLRLLPADSPKLEILLKSLNDADLLWSPYGLRSLAKTSPLYNQRNTEHDPPYWRGAVWMNMNYLALSSLHHYSTTPGPSQDLAFDIYASLRSNVVTNVVKEFRRTGYLWEHYNDVTGEGEGSHPFTGWTSLVLLMMAEQYDW